MNETPAEHASAEAVHKARNAAAAIEIARETQMSEAIEKSALRTKASLLEALREVFGDDNAKTPQEIKVLVQRIPILCTSIIAIETHLEQNSKEIAGISDNIKWGVRVVMGAVMLALLGMVLIP